MKVAFLFSGQYRYIDPKLFRYSLNNLVKGIDYSIFSACWEETGKSLTISNEIVETKKLPNIENKINELFKGFNLKDTSFESFISFKENLPSKYKKILNSSDFHKGTINSLPQIYLINKSYQLLMPFIDEYDLVFRCRYDSLFIHPLKIYDLNKLKSYKYLYNLNFGRSFNPKRIYDIFFGGSLSATYFMATIWDDLPKLINDDFDNLLDKRDSCRLIFLGAYKSKIKVKTLCTRICDVYRMGNNFEYEAYIIQSHPTRLIFTKSFLKFYIYFIKWIKFKKMSKLQLSLLLLKSFFLVPFSFLKRLRFLRSLL